MIHETIFCQFGRTFFKIIYDYREYMTVQFQYFPKTIREQKFMNRHFLNYISISTHNK